MSKAAEVSPPRTLRINSKAAVLKLVRPSEGRSASYPARNKTDRIVAMSVSVMSVGVALEDILSPSIWGQGNKPSNSSALVHGCWNCDREPSFIF